LSGGRASREYQLINLDLTMQRYYVPVVEKLEELRTKTRSGESQDKIWDRLFKQADLAERRYRDFLLVLLEKFDAREITFGRYQSSAWQVFLTILDNLKEAAQHIYSATLSSPFDESMLAKAQFKLSHNEDALRSLEAAHRALTKVETTTNSEAIVSQPEAVRDLEDMAERARGYSR